MDTAVVSLIDARLDALAEEGVQVLWAVESGSRAWGFPSPDSDYDCRFLYRRPVEDYLSLWPARDVIETPLDAVLDVNGWDLAKALRLLERGNATLVEWLRSPLVYRGDLTFRDALLDLADTVVELSTLRRHHLHVARSNWPSNLDDASLKKLFYALRPALTLRWLRLHGSPTPPMDLPTLVGEGDLPHQAVRVVDELVTLKGRTRELGRGPVPSSVVALVLDELDRAEELLAAAGPPVDPAPRRAVIDAFFREAVLAQPARR
ncbi:nucleotidyltransferase domain-containing protein [Auraticoccus monumenti]|nr:nucleotidyltransferase domain-containing protein [Auraticoccus monumenti]